MELNDYDLRSAGSLGAKKIKAASPRVARYFQCGFSGGRKCVSGEIAEEKEL